MVGLAVRTTIVLIVSLAGAFLWVDQSDQTLSFGSILRKTAVVFSGILCVSLFYMSYIWPFYFSPLRHFPTVQGGSYLLNHELTIQQRPHGLAFLKWMESVPNNGLIRFFGVAKLEALLVTSPAVLAEVLTTDAYSYIKPREVQEFLTTILGKGVLLVEGEQHKFQRKNLLPAFHMRHIRELTTLFWAKSIELIDILTTEVESGGTDQDFAEWASEVTFDIIGVAAMGQEFRSLHEEHELLKLFHILTEPSIGNTIFFFINTVFPNWAVRIVFWPVIGQFDHVQGSLQRAARSAVQEQKAKYLAGTMSEDKNILSVALKSEAFTDSELADQLLTFLAAGHETTATSLTWACYMLCLHPEWQTRLRNEIRALCPSPLMTSQAPSAETVDSWPCLNAVVNETLRFMPTVNVTVRDAIKPTTIQGHKIPAGARLFIAPYATNRSTKLWGADADKYDPARWMAPGAANSGGAESNYANLSFLHGPHSCIGQTFAKGSFKCILAALVGRFEFELQNPDEELKFGGTITSKPANGMKLRFKIVEGW